MTKTRLIETEGLQGNRRKFLTESVLRKTAQGLLILNGPILESKEFPIAEG